MTREEAIVIFKEWVKRDSEMEYCDRLENIQLYKMAIKALEQEPCDDAVSRKAVITIIQNHWWNCRDIDKLVNELPSVTPQEPKPMVEIDLYSVIKQKYIEREVLDKIRAEIAELQLIGYATVDGKREIANRAVMQIIDKYKAESEEKHEN